MDSNIGLSFQHENRYTCINFSYDGEGVIQNLHVGPHSHVYYYNNPFICLTSLSIDSRNKLVLNNFPLTKLSLGRETFMCL